MTEKGQLTQIMGNRLSIYATKSSLNGFNGLDGYFPPLHSRITFHGGAIANISNEPMAIFARMLIVQEKQEDYALARWTSD